MLLLRVQLARPRVREGAQALSRTLSSCTEGPRSPSVRSPRADRECTADDRHGVVCQKSIASSCGTPVVEFYRPAQWLAALDRRVPVGRSHRLFSCGAAFTRIKIVGPALPAGAENDPTFNPTSSATACNVWGRLGTAKWRD